MTFFSYIQSIWGRIPIPDDEQVIEAFFNPTPICTTHIRNSKRQEETSLEATLQVRKKNKTSPSHYVTSPSDSDLLIPTIRKRKTYKRSIPMPSMYKPPKYVTPLFSSQKPTLKKCTQSISISKTTLNTKSQK